MRFPRAMLAAAVALLCAAPGATAALPQQGGAVDLLSQRYAQWNGPAEHANAGSGLAPVGDFNGDGADDFAIGAPGADAAPYDDTGAVYVVYGPVSSGAVNLASLGTRGLEIDGNGVGALIGGSVDGAGDVNGDGLDDVVFTSAAGSGGYQVAWVVFGRRTPGTVTLASLGSGGYRVDCAACNIESAAGLGDLNGDGRGDLAFGDPALDEVYVVHGKASDAPSAADVDAAYQLQGVGGSAAGAALDGLGDVDGDGRGDLVVGAPGLGAGPGMAYVVFGRGDTTDVSLEPLGFNGGYPIAGEPGDGNVGAAVAGGGDVNGDDRPDVVVGAPARDGGSGAAYVVFGKEGMDPVALDGLGGAGFKIAGAPASAQLGTSVALLGDVTGDGRADVAASAPQADNVRPDSGSVYVVRGKGDGGVNVDLSGSPPTYGYRVHGAAAGHFLGLGRPLQSSTDTLAGGDVNDDGRADLLTASLFAESNGIADSGSSYTVLGFGPTTTAYDELLARVGARVDHRPNAFGRTGAASFAIDPPLPEGLAIDPETGVISGTAASATADRRHTVTMTDLVGTITTTLRIDIDAAPAATSPPPPAKSPPCRNTVRGTNGRNTLRGTQLGDKLLGLRGNDKLFGGSGDDCLRGGAGHDRLSGGSGKDKLKGDAGHDRLIGSAGNDTITGGSGKDKANGGLGKDTYSMGSGNDSLTTADGVAERVNCGRGRDRVVAADRGDRLRGCERVRRN